MNEINNIDVEIKQFKFDDNVSNLLAKDKFGNSWPVVYIINNAKEAYVGETTNATSRSKQHLANEERRKLSTISIVSDKTFNKSVIQDLEAFLIKHMSADDKFKLQNGNGGLHLHQYYQSGLYEENFKKIWDKLKKIKLVNKSIAEIENSDLFKYSPYKSLTDDQYKIVYEILTSFSKDFSQNKEATYIVNGCPGTGKTIVGIYLLKLLADKFADNDIEDDSIDDETKLIIKRLKEIKKLKIGFVVSMSNLRATLKKVFKQIKGLNMHMVFSPEDLAKTEEKYDFLIIDEAHRLKQRKNITNYKTHDDAARKLGLNINSNELDWILKQSKYQLFMYDRSQTVKPTDIPYDMFANTLNETGRRVEQFTLTSQLRCQGGNDYIEYIKKIFSNNPPKNQEWFDNYEFVIFDDVDVMINEIKNKNNEIGLCRNFAGFAWPWNTKLRKGKKKADYDIEIEGHKYVWNSKYEDFINSKNAINEIGCIHTTQGYDLNYAGIIIGKDIYFDKKENKIKISKSNYYDTNGKNNATYEELFNYICNIYYVLCTRGIKGTYIYVCDDDLREYMKKYSDVFGEYSKKPLYMDEVKVAEK